MTNLPAKKEHLFSKSDYIIQLNDLANQRKKNNIDVINGSIGMFFNEEKHLATFEVVEKALKNSLVESSYVYDSVGGSIEFEHAIKNWIFSNIPVDDNKVRVTATIGATGALSCAMNCYGETNQAVLLPSIRWKNYDSIAHTQHLNVSLYDLFNKDKAFNIDSLKEKMYESYQKYGRVLLLINDPCQNPSGYSMSLDEWKAVIALCKEVSTLCPVILIDDLAYVDYKEGSHEEILKLLLSSSKDNFLILLCFSASKTLQIYGLRGGALLCIAHNKDIADEFKLISKNSCRSTWSSPNHITTSAMCEIFLNENNVQTLKYKLIEYKNLLIERANIFITNAKEYNIEHYPYGGGFFILVKCDNAFEIVERLIEKNIFLVPSEDGIRISIASLSKKEVEPLAKEIALAIKQK